MRTVAERKVPRAFLDREIVNLQMRMIKTNRAGGAQLLSAIGEARDVYVILERVAGVTNIAGSGVISSSVSITRWS